MNKGLNGPINIRPNGNIAWWRCCEKMKQSSCRVQFHPSLSPAFLLKMHLSFARRAVILSGQVDKMSDEISGIERQDGVMDPEMEILQRLERVPGGQWRLESGIGIRRFVKLVPQQPMLVLNSKF